MLELNHLSTYKCLRKRKNSCSQSCIIVLSVFDCSVWKAVDGTHFVRNLISSELAHQEYNHVMKDWHCRAHRF